MRTGCWFAQRPPDVVLQDRVVDRDEEAQTPRSRYQVKLWDEESFTSWEGVKVPLRCLRVEEIRERCEKASAGWRRSSRCIMW